MVLSKFIIVLGYYIDNPFSAALNSNIQKIFICCNFKIMSIYPHFRISYKI